MNKKQFLAEFMEEVWNRKDLECIAKYVHSEYEVKLDPGDPWEGKRLDHETFKQRLKYSFDSFSDMNFEITSMIGEEEHVAITWIMRGTNDGKIGDIPPTHKKIETKGMTIYHFKADKISGHTQIFDRNKVMFQLGFG